MHAGHHSAWMVTTLAGLTSQSIGVLLLAALSMLVPDSISQHTRHPCTKTRLKLTQLLTLLRHTRETQDSTQTQHLHHALATEVWSVMWGQHRAIFWRALTHHPNTPLTFSKPQASLPTDVSCRARQAAATLHRTQLLLTRACKLSQDSKQIRPGHSLEL
jgi:hypothetical protein